MRILVAEDDPKLCAHLKHALQQSGYAVDETGDGQEALWLGKENSYDAAVLDISMPGMDGVSVTRALRKAEKTFPVILSTARGALCDKVGGLDAGADDYLVKPFSTEELLARLRAVLRRRSPDLSSVVRVGDLELDHRTRQARRAGSDLVLTNREFALLEALAEASPRTVTKTSLVERVWDQHFDSGTNVLNVYVNYLRKKVDLPEMLPLIHTVRGVGYALREDPL